MWVMALGSLLCGFSQNVGQLILFRFLQGIGGAMIQSSGRTLAFRAMPAGSEGKAQGLMGDVSSVRILCRAAHRWSDHRSGALARYIFFLFLPSLAGAAMCLWTGRAAADEKSAGQAIDYVGGGLLLALTILATLLMDQKVAEVVGSETGFFVRVGVCHGGRAFHQARKETFQSAH
jgi:MFS family permease